MGFNTLHFLALLLGVFANADGRKCGAGVRASILEPVDGGLVSEPVPVIAFSIQPTDEDQVSENAVAVVSMDGAELTRLGAEAWEGGGQLQMAGLSNGLHTVSLRIECHVSQATLGPHTESTFMFMAPLRELEEALGGGGEEEEWQMSWVASVELRNQMTVAAGARLGVQMRELAQGWRVLAQQQLDKTLELQQRIVVPPSSVVGMLANAKVSPDVVLKGQEELESRLQDASDG